MFCLLPVCHVLHECVVYRCFSVSLRFAFTDLRTEREKTKRKYVYKTRGMEQIQFAKKIKSEGKNKKEMSILKWKRMIQKLEPKSELMKKRKRESAKDGKR